MLEVLPPLVPRPPPPPPPARPTFEHHRSKSGQSLPVPAASRGCMEGDVHSGNLRGLGSVRRAPRGGFRVQAPPVAMSFRTGALNSSLVDMFTVRQLAARLLSVQNGSCLYVWDDLSLTGQRCACTCYVAARMHSLLAAAFWAVLCPVRARLVMGTTRTSIAAAGRHCCGSADSSADETFVNPFRCAGACSHQAGSSLAKLGCYPRSVVCTCSAKLACRLPDHAKLHCSAARQDPVQYLHQLGLWLLQAVQNKQANNAKK